MLQDDFILFFNLISWKKNQFYTPRYLHNHHLLKFKYIYLFINLLSLLLQLFYAEYLLIPLVRWIWRTDRKSLSITLSLSLSLNFCGRSNCQSFKWCFANARSIQKFLFWSMVTFWFVRGGCSKLMFDNRLFVLETPLECDKRPGGEF